MHVIQGLHRFELHNHAVLNQQIRHVLPHDATVVHHGDGMLLENLQARLAKLVGQSIFVHLLQKTTAESIGDRVRATDDRFGQITVDQSVFICVHLWLCLRLLARSE